MVDSVVYTKLVALWEGLLLAAGSRWTHSHVFLFLI